ncbi:hypothetical protein N0V85_000821 [Neurospora sp. IMI 360204]|nr:hypothetical protein N0V85_000821 [Neurospora sp. IMI 360204]
MGRSIAGMRASRENEAERKAALRAQSKNPNKLLAAAAQAAGNPLASPQRMGIKAGASKASSGGVKEKTEEKQSGDDEEVTTQTQNKRRTKSSRIVSEDTENEEDDEDTIQAKRRRRDSGDREMVAGKSQEDEGADVDEEVYD